MLTKVNDHGIVKWIDIVKDEPKKKYIGVHRYYVGETLRDIRNEKGLTLREVSDFGVALGYISEIERGRKEVSSEVLETICQGLDVKLSDVLIRTANKMRDVGK